MKNSNVQITCYEEYARDGIRYVAEIYNTKYEEYKILKDYDKNTLNRRMNTLIGRWDTLDTKEEAFVENAKALELNERINNVLLDVFDVPIHVMSFYKKESVRRIKKITADIEKLKTERQGLYSPTQPTFEKLPEQPVLNIKYNLLDRLLPFLKSIKERKARYKFTMETVRYNKSYQDITAYNSSAQERYDEELAAYNNKVSIFEKKIKKKEEQVKSDEARTLAFIKKFKENLANNVADTVVKYSRQLLMLSRYPFSFNKEISISLHDDLLAIDYLFPKKADIPNVSKVSCVKGELVSKPMTDKAFSQFYETLLYNMTFRCLFEIFNDEHLGAVASIGFNGWVTDVDEATGHLRTDCILSLMVTREQLEQIDLFQIKPKACFKSLKGIACSDLSTITAVRPILNLNKNDHRFIEGYNVVDRIDSGTNLASMHWQDFEHLIRELFEKEFDSEETEVRVTQSSRDGGVDAVIIDPNPIKGGKIVVQAKRYTNTVGVSAVRDLFGTVQHEGANRGILVTTSQYGADSYEFAKDKPLTLLSGNELLYLMQKHGYKARINIAEAKKLITSNNN